jgi:hypothetical protein
MLHSQFTATITKNRNILCFTDDADFFPEHISNFCGKTLNARLNDSWTWESNVHYWICGDIDFILSKCQDNTFDKRNITIVKQQSGAISTTESPFPDNKYDGYQVCTILEIPQIIHDVCVCFQNVFSTLNRDSIFADIVDAHTFHSLTESNKPSNAFRKGVYLTKVEKCADGMFDSYSYHLLRCSSNLGGGSENLQTVDNDIINIANNAVKQCFDNIQTDNVLNHVLAQIYYNTTDENGKDKRRKSKDTVTRQKICHSTG